MSTIIFDFDGTIADSFDYVLDFLAGEAGKETPRGKTAQAEYRQLSMKDMALKLGIPFWRLPLLYFKGRRVMRGHILKVKPFEGMPELVQELHAEGHTLAIISSNSGRNVRKFLERNELRDCFQAVRGGAGLMGKVTPIKAFRLRYKSSDCWYIGDEVTDIASAKAAKVKSLAVTWGFASHADLQRFDPTAVAEQPTDIAKIING